MAYKKTCSNREMGKICETSLYTAVADVSPFDETKSGKERKAGGRGRD